MMTLSEVTPPEGITSTAALDPQKARIARRRRMEINKLKSSCKDQNDVVYSNSRTICYGVVSVKGRRREMEDTVRVEKGFTQVGSTGFDFYGVFDGHGGSHVAEACRERMHVILAEEMVVAGGGVEWGGVMERCFERMDGEVCGGRKAEEVEEMTVGSTVVAAVVGDDVVVVANCGDSRAVLCRDGVAVPLSCDHKPDRPDELARIEGAGGRVINWNGHRVLGVLATSRSIGINRLHFQFVCVTLSIGVAFIKQVGQKLKTSKKLLKTNLISYNGVTILDKVSICYFN
ncbi:hypothetical protein RND81_05G096800 [Saponaria officinalis]|uniref:protein-serine/threonine phosphatase n=1 Tax=Saponaria officinalis TaxID=3572 RepID=A0AAW1KWQ0_SAPOF